MNLKELYNKHFEGLDHCAEKLGVSRRTVENYIYSNPTGILKHSGQLMQMDGVDPFELFDVVAENVEQIKTQTTKSNERLQRFKYINAQTSGIMAQAKVLLKRFQHRLTALQKPVL